MKKKRSQPHGLAAMLVLIVVALATLLSLAMLSSASLQASVSDSAARGAVADYMTSSALQTATHYLQYPTKIPASWTRTGYAFYVSGATVSGVSGSFDVNATLTVKADTYLISATGYSGSTNAVTRSATAQVQLQRATPSTSGAFGTGTFKIPLGYTFNGPALVNGSLSPILGTVTGTINQTPGASDFVVPTTSTINYFGAGATPTTYTMPDLITTPTLSAQPIAKATNPGKVFYINSPLKINNTSSSTPLQLTGTFIVASGSLTMQNSNAIGITPASVVITPQTGFPALIVNQNIIMSTKNIGLTANGVVWTGTGITWNAGVLNSSLVINGSLLLPATGSLGNITLGSATINYTAANSAVKNMTTSVQPIIGTKYLSWSQ
jgi:hypothetical protein